MREDGPAGTAAPSAGAENTPPTIHPGAPVVSVQRANSVGRTITSTLSVFALVLGLLSLLGGVVIELDLFMHHSPADSGLGVGLECLFLGGILIAGLVILWATLTFLRWGFTPEWPLLIHRMSLCIGVVALCAGLAAPLAGLGMLSWIVSPAAVALAALTWGPSLARFRAKRIQVCSGHAAGAVDASASLWSAPPPNPVQRCSNSNRPARSMAGLVTAACLLVLGLLSGAASFTTAFGDDPRPPEPEAQLGAAAGRGLVLTVCPVLAVMCLGSSGLIFWRLHSAPRDPS